VVLGQHVPEVGNLHEHESAGTQDPSDLGKQGARISDMLEHVDERDHIKRGARKTCFLQRSSLDIQVELFTREAGANRARLYPDGTPAPLSCSPQEEATVATDIEEVAWAPESLEHP
jgi:hypothetical protein